MLRKLSLVTGLLVLGTSAQAAIDISQVPLFVSDAVPPLNMLVMGRDHKLYYEAYNDASDLNGDGVIDVGYKGYLPEEQGGIDYFGYFNSYVCYDYTGGTFIPSVETADKTCTNKWSGDYLNYLATARIDALRKVLYGGYRVTDSTTQTILQGSFIPQDAHTWGKEYTSLAVDGFRISNYTPLNQPVAGYRHLFAVASLTDGGIPQLRTLTNTTFRIWNWVSKERPVAGDQCVNSALNNVACTSAGPSSGWVLIPDQHFSGLVLKTWRDSTATSNNKSEMDALFVSNDNGRRCGTGNVSSVQQNFGSGNPFNGNSCTGDNYNTLLEGSFIAPATGNYEFSVDGDDAVEFSVGNDIVASWYGNHGPSNVGGSGTTGSKYLTAGQSYSVRVRHEENGGGSQFNIYWKTPGAGTSEMVDRNVKVSVCPASSESLREENCVVYSNGQYKPTGILHDYGTTDRMYFGLLSGSYAKPLSGGVLRSQLQSFSRELNAATGQFCSSGTGVCSAANAVSNGIVSTINKLRVIDFSYDSQTYGCGWITTRPITADDTCYMWGNPVAEMMYETMRYFSGATTPTADFNYSGGKDAEPPLQLPKVDSWTPPYKSPTNPSGFEQCAVPVMTVISDINPSYDFNLPGSNWGAINGSGNPASIRSLNVSTEADLVWTKEGGGSRSVFIGESNGVSDSAPTPKTVSNFSTIRGLSPEEPSKQGTYYSAAVSHFGANNAIGGEEKLITYSVALASPLPTIDFPVGTSIVTIVPFAKSVGGDSINATAEFQPTDQIVDYYVETIANTDASCRTSSPSSAKDCDSSINSGRPYAKFRINFEDVEQGADHDMDAIAVYEILINAQGKLDINITSEYAAGGIDQHMGYVISGTTKDGIYLEVKDRGGADIKYKLDTPSGSNEKWAGDCAINGASCANLGLTSSRTFTASGGSSANLLKDPLWYAAKYGTNAANFDEDGDGTPDNYFLVTNALTLKEQLDKAFNAITQMNASVSTPSVDVARNTSVSDDQTAFVYRTVFDINGWSGDLIKERQVTSISTGSPVTTVTEVWTAEGKLPLARNILMADYGSGSAGTDRLAEFSWAGLDGVSYAGTNIRDMLNRRPDSSGTSDGYGEARVKYIRGESCGGVDGCSSFPERTSELGDIVGSSPVLVKDAQYLAYRAGTVDGTSSDYSEFQQQVAARPETIYVGANDGMLHSFDAESGVENFGFIPSAVMENLNKLTTPNYGGGSGIHQYYVDGAPVVADVYFDSEWHTVLVGSLGAGGREVFAMDVTDPQSPMLLWELTNNDQPDLGYTIPTPKIVRLHSGQWAALIPNGYNGDRSAEGKAVLFVVDIKTGEVLRKLEATTESDGAINSGNNGLSNVQPADINGDGVVDYAYAGDIQGNLWRFDLLNTASATPFAKTVVAASTFQIAYGGKPLFVAKNSSGTRQPITAAPSLVKHPSSVGYLVTLGTGSYLNSADKASTAVQSVYGIWDRKTAGEVTQASTAPSISRASLVAQTMLSQQSFSAGGVSWPVRTVSQNDITWYSSSSGGTTDSNVAKWGWYLDLNVSGATADGERVINDMRVYGDGLIFSTVTPNTDPCAAGLSGFTYGINPRTGGRTTYHVFDFNGDGLFDMRDAPAGSNAAVSGYSSPAGGSTINGGNNFYTDGTSVGVAAGLLSQGRQNWRLIPKNVD
ncbi:MAG: PilC/PilY family type IV pilus protein [Halopseudomonas sp.]|uniref:PilC/PilY family type IV pilus protein n=1 Tax=Halopseudomonas sp. TaxID=2901191 RepID=UPI003003A0D7